ncbi:hypothetical protein DESC_810075 [Desulfosarcina cetonica]|nr:hypothetical protein DESC_810075 [Desulfosarcina cetonica]
MLVSGRQARSVFDRYKIVNDPDPRAAARQQEKSPGKVTGTIHDFTKKSSPKKRPNQMR